MGKGKQYNLNLPYNIEAVRKNITWKKGKGKQFNLPYNIQAVRKNMKWGEGED